MAVTLNRGNPEIKTFGTLEQGVVEYGDNFAEYKRYTPKIFSENSQTIVLATGLGISTESLDLPCTTIADLGHTAVSVGHTHHRVRSPIRSNAEDIQAVVSELNDLDDEFHAVGLSRGWPAQVLVAKHIPSRVISLHGIAPAMMTRIKPSRSPRLAHETASEALITHSFSPVVFDCFRTVKSRFATTTAEAVLLMKGDVNQRVKMLKPSIIKYLIAMENDCFFDPNDQVNKARELGFKERNTEIYNSGTAGHSALTYDRKVTERIVSNIEKLVSIPVKAAA